MEVLFSNDFGQTCSRSKPGQEQNRKCQTAEHLPNADENWKHGGNPISFERHNPVDQDQGYGERIQGQGWSTQFPKFFRWRDIPSEILLVRPLYEPITDRTPQNKEDCRTHDK